jgi:hypothetical protein
VSIEESNGVYSCLGERSSKELASPNSTTGASDGKHSLSDEDPHEEEGNDEE